MMLASPSPITYFVTQTLPIMSNPAGNPQSIVNSGVLFPAQITTKSVNPYSQALKIQKLLMQDIQNPKTKPSIRAGLARAWDVIEERKRILRGVPLPGQLRPDLDPVQMAKALKRSRTRKPIDLLTAGNDSGFSGPSEEHGETDDDGGKTQTQNPTIEIDPASPDQAQNPSTIQPGSSDQNPTTSQPEPKPQDIP